MCRPAWRVGEATHVAGSSTCAPRVPRPTASQTHPLIFPSEGDPRAGRVDDERDPWGGCWWGRGGGQSFISVEESRTLRPALWGKLKFPLGKKYLICHRIDKINVVDRWTWTGGRVDEFICILKTPFARYVSSLLYRTTSVLLNRP